MSSIAIHQIITFASEPFGGNPAFVITLDAPQPASVLQGLSRQLREPVLAVLLRDGGGLRLDYVTSDGTHPGAGHATHAAAWVALHRLHPGTSSLDLRLAGGGTRLIRLDENGRISVDWPVMAFSPTDAVSELAAALGRTPRETFASTFGLIAVLETTEEVASLEPDLAAVARLRSDTVIVTASGADTDFSIRVFAPKIGLPEDPVCGTAHRILVPLWAERLGRSTLSSHQLSKRGGRLYCQLDGPTVTISGDALLFLEGSLSLSA